MAINKNHEFDELNGIKCSIVEKEVSTERVQFLKNLLELNHYTVVVVPSPPARKPAAPPAGTEAASPEPEPMPETFTVGVTDLMFNPTNAIFGRLLKTADHHIVTLAYWHQKEKISEDDIPYYEDKNYP